MSAGGEAAAQSTGILGSLFDAPQLGPQQNVEWLNSLFDRQHAASMGNNPLPVFDPFADRLPTGFGPPTATAWSAPTSQNNLPRGEVASLQLPGEPGLGAERATPQNQAAAGAATGSPIPTPLSPQFPYQAEPPSPGQDAPQNEASNDFHVQARLYQPDIEGEGPKDALDDRSDWSAYLQRAQYVDPSAITGNPQVDRTTKLLVDVLAQSAKTMGQAVPPGMRATVFGIHVHYDFGTRVKALDLPGIGQDGVEQSWSLEALARYGLADSIRTDIYLRDRFGTPIAIYDLKTGNGQLTPRRIKELQNAVGAGDIPVIELRLIDLTALQR